MRATVDRHDIGRKIFKSIGDAAPAMGMIGTLIGLVQMLSNMSDLASIGPSMAVALLTTLYGAMIANIFAIPIADKLALRTDEERMVKSVIIAAAIPNSSRKPKPMRNAWSRPSKTKSKRA